MGREDKISDRVTSILKIWWYDQRFLSTALQSSKIMNQLIFRITYVSVPKQRRYQVSPAFCDFGNILGT